MGSAVIFGLFSYEKTERAFRPAPLQFLAQKLAGFRIDPIHPLTSRADDCFKSVIAAAVVFSVPLHIQVGSGRRNESSHKDQSSCVAYLPVEELQTLLPRQLRMFR